jgi:hypothetical protein
MPTSHCYRYFWIAYRTVCFLDPKKTPPFTEGSFLIVEVLCVLVILFIYVRHLIVYFLGLSFRRKLSL